MTNTAKKLSVVGLLVLVSTPGCLTTRAELRDQEVKRTQVSAAQEKRAQETARFDEYDQQMRGLNGRMDVIENQVSQFNAGFSDKQNQESRYREDVDRRFRAYEEALKKLDQQVAALGEEIKELKTVKVKKEGPVSEKEARDHFAAAEEAFNKKDWKQAILDYEAYRKAFPKGKQYPGATLKIGLCFAELGMKDEAKAFLEEVAAKFPSSKEAKKASQRLKSMK